MISSPEVARPRTTTVLRLAVAQIAVAKVRFFLRTLGFARTVRLLGMIPALTRASLPDPRWSHEIAMAARPPIGGTCLDRTVALWWALRLHGLDGDIRIGLARSGDTYDGHAWLEWNGTVLNDEPNVADGYAVFDGDPAQVAFR